jgi:hypothetical protein
VYVLIRSFGGVCSSPKANLAKILVGEKIICLTTDFGSILSINGSLDSNFACQHKPRAVLQQHDARVEFSRAMPR